MQRGDLDGNEDRRLDDDDVLTLAHFPEVLPVVTKKQAETKMNLDGRKQISTWYEIVPTAVSYRSIREMVLTSCGKPSRITCNQIAPGTYPCCFV